MRLLRFKKTFKIKLKGKNHAYHFFDTLLKFEIFLNVRKKELQREQPKERIKINNVPLIHYERNNWDENHLFNELIGKNGPLHIK